MQKTFFVLKEKKLLTKDVFHLVFESQSPLDFTPGQFITFLLPQTKFARAYSIFWKSENTFEFLIKRLEQGRGGSKEICDLPLETQLVGIGPIGHLILGEESQKYLFIGTGTGIVPLYAMMRSLLERGCCSKIHLVVGNRYREDVYLLEEFESFARLYSHFSFTYYLSQDTKEGFQKGRVTEFFGKKTSFFSQCEVFVCGNPEMVDSVCHLLALNGVGEEHIHCEKY